MKKTLKFLLIIFYLNFIIGFVIEKSIGSSDEITLGVIYKSIAYLLDIPLIYYFIKSNKNEKYFEKKEKMNFVNLISYFVLMELFTRIINMIFFLYEVSVEDYSSDISASYLPVYINITVFLTVIITPVVEEMIFRGVVMNALKKYGYKSSIIINSVLFGIAHGNIKKIVIATFFGIVLSYVAYRYSLKSSILLHMLWNFNSSMIIYYKKVPREIIVWVMSILTIVLLLIFFMGLIRKKYRPIFFIFRFNGEDKKNMILFFRNNAVFLIIISILFFLTRYTWYL